MAFTRTMARPKSEQILSGFLSENGWTLSPIEYQHLDTTNPSLSVLLLRHLRAVLTEAVVGMLLVCLNCFFSFFTHAPVLLEAFLDFLGY